MVEMLRIKKEGLQLQEDRGGRSPWMLAAMNGHVKVKYLYEY